jgi:hypothetical protein
VDAAVHVRGRAGRAVPTLRAGRPRRAGVGTQPRASAPGSSGRQEWRSGQVAAPSASQGRSTQRFSMHVSVSARAGRSDSRARTRWSRRRPPRRSPRRRVLVDLAGPDGRRAAAPEGERLGRASGDHGQGRAVGVGRAARAGARGRVRVDAGTVATRRRARGAARRRARGAARRRASGRRPPETLRSLPRLRRRPPGRRRSGQARPPQPRPRRRRVKPGPPCPANSAGSSAPLASPWSGAAAAPPDPVERAPPGARSSWVADPPHPATAKIKPSTPRFAPGRAAPMAVACPELPRSVELAGLRGSQQATVPIGHESTGCRPRARRHTESPRATAVHPSSSRPAAGRSARRSQGTRRGPASPTRQRRSSWTETASSLRSSRRRRR